MCSVTDLIYTENLLTISAGSLCFILFSFLIFRQCKRPKKHDRQIMALIISLSLSCMFFLLTAVSFLHADFMGISIVQAVVRTTCPDVPNTVLFWTICG